MRALKIRGKRANLLLLVQGRSRGILLHRVFRDKVATIRDKAMAIKAMAKVNHPKMRGISGCYPVREKDMFPLPPTLTHEMGIVLIDRDPRVLGHPSPNHQWDIHRLNLFLLILPWARGTSISLKVLYKPLLLHNQVR